MRIDIVTLFPEMFAGPLDASILGRGRKHGLVEIGFVNPRDFARDKRRTVDDRPYGGGPGMVMMAQPLYDALKSVRRKDSFVAHLSPRGRPFNQALAADLSRRKHLVLLCGHYEGVDERLGKYVDIEVSIGDYVLTGGEIPAMVVADAVARLARGVLSAEAVDRESFSEGLLEHPQYTRPRVWRGMRVPDVLLTGHHERVDTWRRRQSIQATRRKRPDLMRASRRTEVKP